MRFWRLLMLLRSRRVGVMVQRRMHVVVIILGLGGRSELHRWVLLRGGVCGRPLVAICALPPVSVGVRISVRVDVRARIGVWILRRARHIVVGVYRPRGG